MSRRSDSEEGTRNDFFSLLLFLQLLTPKSVNEFLFLASLLRVPCRVAQCLSGLVLQLAATIRVINVERFKSGMEDLATIRPFKGWKQPLFQLTVQAFDLMLHIKHCNCACVCVIAGGMGGCCVTARLGTQNKTLFFCLQSRRAECQQQDSVAGHQIPARHGGTQ